VTGYFRYLVVLIATASAVLGAQLGFTQSSAAVDPPTGFPPLDQWRNAIVAGDAAGLKALYSADPAAQVEANGVAASSDADANFWLGLKARSMKLDLFPANADARAEIKEAEEKAGKERKRIVMVFGANWCYDCHVLDLAFHRPDFASAMASYEVVHVDIGPDGQKNGDLAKEFQVPLDEGIPALAVLEGDGKLVVSQKNGEFEDARSLTPEALLEFLNKWKSESR
jgi:thioredoxin 1